MTPVYLKSRIFNDVVYFFMLVAFAMMWIRPSIIFILAVFVTVLTFEIIAPDNETGYIAIARSVCKIE